ncbi:hypothetical protein CFS9_02560 [Flavobacterium sp. CFS9]|uniref:DUF306 domain-containing protein n=1 Tax=Flavobacterium sp. CFS9 TaxID=3143118 RepID=A0AAT9GWM1_9FLAO
MIKSILSFVFLGIVLVSCNCSKGVKGDNASKLEGNWELNYISGSGVDFDALYPNNKPTINFNLTEKRVSGNNGCNSFNGALVVTGSKIDLTHPMATTKKMCPQAQEGERLFMGTLPKITSYDITDEGKTLHFISADIALMRFTRK